MGKAGRKRRAGPRTKSGRLSRVGIGPAVDRGNDRAQAMRALYGENWADPIGRAFEAGLLGTSEDPRGADAKVLLDTARAIHVAYWCAYIEQPIRCTLADRSFGNLVSMDHHKAKKREQWLNECLAVAKPHRRVFDQLVIDVNPDQGPDWLDRLVYSRKGGGPARLSDYERMDTAVAILGEIAG